MRYYGLKAASVAVVLGMGAIAASAQRRLPADALLPLHWNIAGQPDRFVRAPVALLLPVILCAFFSLLMAAIPRIEPMQRDMEQSAPLFRAAWAGTLAILLLIELAIAAPAFDIRLPGTLPLMGAGTLLIVIGNVLPKSRPGFFVGIRTPWTLADPATWIATHRLGARTMIAGGAIILLAALPPIAPAARGAAVLGGLALAVLPPIIFSYLHWHRAHRA